MEEPCSTHRQTPAEHQSTLAGEQAWIEELHCYMVSVKIVSK